MHPVSLRRQALDLVAEGLADAEIARRLEVPRTTVRDWRAPRYVARVPRPTSVCPRCWRSTPLLRFTPADYCFLLGLYLGDGCISRMGRTYRLRISLDSKYPAIMEEVRGVLERCFPHNPVGMQLADAGSCTILGVYSNHLPCLLPQHGPGRKHERRIALEPWQEALVTAEPWALLRGLIWTDGCSFVNRHGRYEDLCFAFANRSTDLLDLFARTCETVGLPYRRYEPRPEGDRVRVGSVRINRREPVARLVEHVGVKR